MRLRSHTGRGDVARVNQSCLTANIWLREECSNTILDRSKGQHNQLRDTREWRNKVARGQFEDRSNSTILLI